MAGLAVNVGSLRPPALLNQIPPDQEICTVTADGACDTRKCHDAIAARNAHAVFTPRRNAKLWKADTPRAKARDEAVRASKYLDRALWRNLSGYHRRSRVETKMNCVKLLGQRLSRATLIDRFWLMISALRCSSYSLSAALISSK